MAALIKILEVKGFPDHNTICNILHYYLVIGKEHYKKHDMMGIMQRYFDNSYTWMLGFFAEEQNLSGA